MMLGLRPRPRGPARRRGWVAVLIVPLILAGGMLAAASARSDVQAPGENPIGVHSMLQLSYPPSFMETMFAEAVAVHATTLRLDVSPSEVFTAPLSEPDYTGLDEVVALAREYHIRVVADVSTIPWWLAACSGITDVFALTRCATDDLGSWASVLGQIVTRADGAIADWEIWNEPNSPSVFNGSPAQYAWMLRTAYDTIKELDPSANVVLGGVSNAQATGWLAAVFATPEADAVHAFDVANLHERGPLDALAGDVRAFRAFLTGSGFTGPLWVTEHGYPSSSADQYDPSFGSGETSQAAYLRASIPTLLMSGANIVFVTERDNLAGPFASEGIIGGNVRDPPVAFPQIVEKSALGTVRDLGDCYEQLGRDCAGAAPAGSPSPLTVPVPLGSVATASVTIHNPGPGPMQLGALTFAAGSSPSITIAGDSCSTALIEPDESCAVMLRFADVTSGSATATLMVPSNNGELDVPVTAIATSVSKLSARVSVVSFTPSLAAADGVGYQQRSTLVLFNPLGAGVNVQRTLLSGPDASSFVIASDSCAAHTIAAGAWCQVSLQVIPRRVGVAHAVLTLSGDGSPLAIPLSASAAPLPAVTLLAWRDGRACYAETARNRVLSVVNQPGSVSWKLQRASRSLPGACARVPGARGASTARRTVSIGLARTATRSARTRGVNGYLAQFALPWTGLVRGTYLLTLTATSRHGSGSPRSLRIPVP